MYFYVNRVGTCFSLHNYNSYIKNQFDIKHIQGCSLFQMSW